LGSCKEGYAGSKLFAAAVVEQRLVIERVRSEREQEAAIRRRPVTELAAAAESHKSSCTRLVAALRLLTPGLVGSRQRRERRS